AVPVPRLRAGEQRVEARVHDRARGHAARANDAGTRSRAADPGDRRRPAMVRPEGRHLSAELLRGGPRRVLAAPVLELPRDRERGRGLVEHRSESPAPAREVGCPGCPQAARDAAALPRGRARRVERRARAHGRGGGSAPAASRAPDLEAGTHAGGEPDHRPARDPGYRAAAGNRHRGRGQDGAPVGRLARARGAAGSVGAGVGDLFGPELEYPPLSTTEIQALPEGARVIVAWSGGNGPHEYRVHWHRGEPY